MLEACRQINAIQNNQSLLSYHTLREAIDTNILIGHKFLITRAAVFIPPFANAQTQKDIEKVAAQSPPHPNSSSNRLHNPPVPSSSTSRKVEGEMNDDLRAAREKEFAHRWRLEQDERRERRSGDMGDDPSRVWNKVGVMVDDEDVDQQWGNGKGVSAS